MFIVYHPRWLGPRLYQNAERTTYALMPRPLYEYVVVKFNGRRQVLANFHLVPDKEFTWVQKYLEDL